MQLKSQAESLQVYRKRAEERNAQIRKQMREFDANLSLMEAKTERLRVLKV